MRRREFITILVGAATWPLAATEARKHEIPPFAGSNDDVGLSAGTRGDKAMAITYREIAMQEMLRTVEEAMSQVINWWGDLPPPMKEAIEQFRIQLGAAIDSVEFVKRALDRQVHENDRGKNPD